LIVALQATPALPAAKPSTPTGMPSHGWPDQHTHMEPSDENNIAIL
jgi:hypothetical protein